MNYIKNKNTYFDTPKDDQKDRIEVEIGDSKQEDFFPPILEELKPQIIEFKINRKTKVNFFQVSKKPKTIIFD